MRTPGNTRAFTMIELMVVIVIIGILAALAIPRFSRASNPAKEKEADAILKQVYTLQQTYHARNGVYAATVPQLATVGFEEPPPLQHFTWAGDASIADGACLARRPATATHHSRAISFASGDLSDC
jgi:prepilin-type N-terminal cleavage/methylation domain-containing protein